MTREEKLTTIKKHGRIKQDRLIEVEKLFGGPDYVFTIADEVGR